VKPLPKQRYFTVLRWNMAWAVAEMLGPYIVNRASVLFTEKVDAEAQAKALAERTGRPFLL